jgi:hypothetical protein
MKAESPTYYLGNDIKKSRNYLHVSSKKHFKEVLQKYQEKHGDVNNKNIPMTPKMHPELDDSELLGIEGVLKVWESTNTSLACASTKAQLFVIIFCYLPVMPQDWINYGRSSL